MNWKNLYKTTPKKLWYISGLANATVLPKRSQSSKLYCSEAKWKLKANIKNVTTWCDTLSIKEYKWRLSKFKHVDFITILKQKGGGITSRNYHECDLNIRIFFSLSWNYVIIFTSNLCENILEAIDYIQSLLKQILLKFWNFLMFLGTYMQKSLIENMLYIYI